MADSTARSNGAVSATSGQLDPIDDGQQDDPVLDDLLVEDVSIDGMCGVY
jgi:mycofactocin precursor